MEDLAIVVEEDGVVKFIYSDDVAELFEGEESATRRASHVEPVEGGGWFADMSPVGGPVLYASGPIDGRTHVLLGVMRSNRLEIAAACLPTPFRSRREALDAEVAWLRSERGL